MGVVPLKSYIQQVVEESEPTDFAEAIQAWRDMGNDYGRIQLVKQYFMCINGEP